MCIVHSLWVSKLRYGLQLCTRVILKEEERRSASLKSLQLTQNRMLRGINWSKISDQIGVKSMLTKFGLLSVNQLAAQIKLVEVWKSINVPGYPLSLDAYNPHQAEPSHDLRARPNRIFTDSPRLQISQHSFSVDAARIWNRAPLEISISKTLASAKKAILKFVMTLPI